MATFTIQAAPLPTNFRGTPQQWFDAMLDRMEILSDGASFVISGTQPDGNQGPWFKNGTQLWVWDEGTSTYIPLDVSASVSDQISVGSDTPDPEDFSLWLKLDGSTVLGLFYYAGSELGWVTKTELGAGVITTAMLANGSVTTDKLGNGSVTAAKLASELPLTVLSRGTAYQVPRMNSAASAASWTDGILESVEIPIVEINTELQAAHGLTRKPRYVRAVLVCKELDSAVAGFLVGDEVDSQCFFSYIDDSQFTPIVVSDDENLYFSGSEYKTALRGAVSTRNQITFAKWRLKFYYAP